MKWKFQTAGRLLALLALSGALLAAPLPAQAAPGVLTGLTGTGSKLELELTEMELEITDDDPRPKGYLYTSGQSDYYFIVWMSSNSNVATVDGDGKVTGRNAGTAIITAISWTVTGAWGWRVSPVKRPAATAHCTDSLAQALTWSLSEKAPRLSLPEAFSSSKAAA